MKLCYGTTFCTLALLTFVTLVFSQTEKKTRHNNCGYSKFPSNITAGSRKAQLGAWPWMVALYFDEGGNKTARCGGSLISSTRVLTAANCVTDRRGNKLPSGNLSVRLGDLDLLSSDDGAKPEDIAVESIIIHPQFNRSSFHNDIAILELKRPAVFSTLIQPICLPDEPSLLTDNYEGYSAIVAGWGSTYYNGPKSPELLEAVVPVWNTTICRQLFDSLVEIREHYVCAGSADDGKGACEGFAGGPLMLTGTEGRYHVIGIVSYGIGCGLRDYLGVYTNVRIHLDWITQNLKQ